MSIIVILIALWIAEYNDLIELPDGLLGGAFIGVGIAFVLVLVIIGVGVWLIWRDS